MEDVYPEVRKLEVADQKKKESIQQCENFINEVQEMAQKNSESLVAVLSALEMK